MDYFIGIASYKRADNCRTLDFLERIGFPRDQILLSVQTQKDAAAYMEAGVHKRVGVFAYQEANTAGENRNTILNHLANRTMLVLMDDDIISIETLDESGTGLRAVETLEEFDAIVKRGFRLAKKNGTLCWGVYPVRNAYFMSNGYARRNVVTTQVMGMIVSDFRFAQGLRTKDDYELCCRVIRRHGACIRLNDVTINAPKSKGGCEEAWRDKAAAKRVAEMLCAKYPDILRLNPRREGEVLMVRNTKTKERS